MRGNRLAIIATIACALPTMASAATITWSITGVVNQQFNLEGLGIAVGDPFSFRLIFDSSAPLINLPACASGPSSCRYDGASFQFTGLRVGSVGPFDSDFAGDDVGTITVRDNDPISPNDLVTLYDGVSFGRRDLGEVLEGNMVRSVDLWGIIFRTTDTGAWNSSAIPTDPTGFSSWFVRSFELCGSSMENGPDTICDRSLLRGTITGVSRVPEPGTLALLGLGLAGLMMSRRRG